MTALSIDSLLARSGIHADWFSRLVDSGAERCRQSLENIAALGIPTDLLQMLLSQLAEHVPGIPDAEIALNNLDRFIAVSRSPFSCGLTGC